MGWLCCWMGWLCCWITIVGLTLPDCQAISWSPENPKIASLNKWLELFDYRLKRLGWWCESLKQWCKSENQHLLIRVDMNPLIGYKSVDFWESGPYKNTIMSFWEKSDWLVCRQFWQSSLPPQWYFGPWVGPWGSYLLQTFVLWVLLRNGLLLPWQFLCFVMQFKPTNAGMSKFFPFNNYNYNIFCHSCWYLGNIQSSEHIMILAGASFWCVKQWLPSQPVQTEYQWEKHCLFSITS